MRPIVVLTCALFLAFSVNAQTSAFTYQGKLTDAGTGANGQYDLTFRLFSDAGGTTQVGGDIVQNDVQVTSGIFTVTLDFGASPFTSAAGNYLQISVRPGQSTGAYTPLTPLQPITSSPYAVSTLRAQSAAAADDASKLGGIAPSQYVQTADTRLTDSRTPTAGSPNYIQNSTSQQPTSNFNISGKGTADLFDAANEFDIGGNRVLSVAGFDNFFAGLDAGPVNTGSFNTFVGAQAGFNNTSGADNTFVGLAAGGSNVSGAGNSIFGRSAGLSGGGNDNSFFGKFSGQITTGARNSFFGTNAGANLGSGSDNTYIGSNARNSGAGSASLNNSTAIGANSTVSQSNSLILGSINGQNGATADVNVGIGTSAPLFKLEVRTGTDENVAVRPGSVFGGGLTGIALQSVNDVNSAYKALDLEGSQITMNIGSGGRVGVGTATPSARLSVVGGGFAANAFFSDGNATATTLDIENTSSAVNWRLQTNGNGDPSRSGNLEMWKVGGGNGLTITPSGNVGMGTLTPNSKLEVNGIVQSTSGGIKFPDGTLQSTAASNATYTNFQNNFVDLNTGLVTIAHLNLPAGSYFLEAEIRVANIVNSNFSEFQCSITGVSPFQYFFTVPSNGSIVSIHTVAPLPATGVDLQCKVFSGGAGRVIDRRLTAVTLAGPITVQ